MTWRTTRLKYLAAVPITNGLGEAAQDSDPAWPRYIRTTDIASPRNLHADRRVSLPPEVGRRSMVQTGDLLMCAAGSLGKVYLHQDGEPACYAGYLVRFRPRLDVVDPRFVAYWAESQPFLDQISVGAVRSTIDNFSAGKYQQMDLSLPSLDEQRRIADFLDGETARIDQLIQLRERQAEAVTTRLDAHAASAITGVNGTPLPMRRVMARWIDYRGATPTKSTSGVRLITASNIKHGEITFAQSEEFIPEEDYDAWMRRGLPEQGDVLLTTEAPLGETAQIEATDVGLAQRIILLRTDPSRCLPRWLYWWLRSPLGRAALRAHATGSTAPGIKADRLRAIPLPVPDLQAQARVIQELDRSQVITLKVMPLLARQVALLHERRMSLITAAVTGELNVAAAAGGAAC